MHTRTKEGVWSRKVLCVCVIEAQIVRECGRAVQIILRKRGKITSGVGGGKLSKKKGAKERRENLVLCCET